MVLAARRHAERLLGEIGQRQDEGAIVVVTANDAPGRPQSAVEPAFIESAEQNRTEVHGALATVGRRNADEFVSKRAADEDFATISKKAAVATQPNVVTKGWWFGALEPAWIVPR